MCGVLYVEDLRGIELSQENLKTSTGLLETRGPAATVSGMSRDKSRYFANAILPISPGHSSESIKFPDIGSDVFAYNGELYGFSVPERENAAAPTDTFRAHALIRNGHFADLLETPGFFSFFFRESIDEAGFELLAGTDLFGEKSLFYHFGERFLVVSSSPEPIVSFLIAEKQSITPNRDLVIAHLASRNTISGAGSFLNEVKRLPSGRVFRFNNGNRAIIPVSQEVIEIVLKHALEQEPSRTTIQEEIGRSFSGLNPNNLATTFSGGIDSSVITGRLAQEFGGPSILAITLDFGAKDPSAAPTRRLAKSLNITNHVFHSVTPESYTDAFQRLIPGICAPLPTHSVVSAFILNEIVATAGKTVLFGGGGADEIYGGYSAYRTMSARDAEDSISEYSSFRTEGAFAHVFEKVDMTGLKKVTSLSSLKDSFLAAGFSSSDATLKASQWLDVELNLYSTDLFPNDWVAGKFGIENRSPLVSLRNVTEGLFSQNSIGTDGRLLDKPALRSEFSLLFDGVTPSRKYGFSGFPNEAGFEILAGEAGPNRLMDFLRQRLPRFSDPNISRRESWKLMNLEIFLREIDSFSSTYFAKLAAPIVPRHSRTPVRFVS